jgi:hypothetical protein
MAPPYPLLSLGGGLGVVRLALLLGAPAVASSAAELIWQQSTASATYTTASISRHPAGGPPTFVAATWLATPIMVEAFNTSDNGEPPLWSFSGCGHVDSAFWATTARHTQRPGGGGAAIDTLAVETEALPPAAVSVRAFDSRAPGGSIPRWSYNLSSAQPASIDLSDDGSTAALACWQWNASGEITSWLFVFDAQSGALRFSLQEPLARGGPCTLSGSGAYVAWTQGDGVAVVDGSTGKQRGSLIDMGWNTEAQISDDGDTLVFMGKQDGRIYHWNESAGDYTLAHTLTPQDDTEWYSDSSSLASNSAAHGDVAAFGFLGGGALQARVLIYEASGAASGTLLSDYTTKKNTKLQTNTYLRSDGDFVGVALWGDSDDVPTAVLLRAGNNTPLFSFVTPGSMMGVDVLADGADVYLAVAGKHVPANVVGNGGDAYTWRISGA